MTSAETTTEIPSNSSLEPARRQHSTPPARLDNVQPHEWAFLHLVQQHGIDAPQLRRAEGLTAQVAADGQSDCWTHAWNIARRLRARDEQARYIEGTILRPGAGGPSFHAWVEEYNPLLGWAVVECTPGYEQASHYRGIAVDCSVGGLVEDLTSDWPKTERYSVLQALLAGGSSPAATLEVASGRRP